MMHLRSYMMMLTLLLIGLTPGGAQARDGRLSGEILYGTAQYRAEVDGKEEERARSTYEQVSLRYANQGLLGDRRIGQYRLMLGYEFNLLDPEVFYRGERDQTAQRIQTDKILYRGEILVAPGGLPFRVTAYVRDLHASAFVANGVLGHHPVGRQGADNISLLDPEVLTEINNGARRELGATFLLGIRNGSYLGAYRDVLSQLPRLLIDYKQIDVEDLARDSNTQHFRSRDLAFISLNKKDNWVHLRSSDHVDFLDSRNNSATSQVLIGTIDHNLSRQWINLTNWIKISGDLSLNSAYEEKRDLSEKSYIVNLLAVGQKKTQRTTVFTNFERTTRNERESQEADVPITFSFAPNRDSLYRGSLKGRFSRESLLDDFVTASDTSLRRTRTFYFDAGAELFRTRAIVFKPRLELEVAGDDNAEGLTEKISLEWSRQRGAEGLFWTAGGARTTAQMETANYQEERLYGNAEKNLGRTMRVGGRASLTRGRGEKDGLPSFVTEQSTQLETTGNSLNKKETSRFQMLSGQVFIEHTARSYVNRLSLNSERVAVGDVSVMVTEVEHMLRRRGRGNEFTLTSILLFGDNVGTRQPHFDFLQTKIDNSPTEFSWSSNADYHYRPDRHLDLALNGDVSGREGGENDNLSWRWAEKLDYRFFTINGVSRTVAEISQELGGENVKEGANGRDSAIFLRLAGSYYPTKYLYAKASSEFVRFGPSGAGKTTYGGETGLNFEKLQLAVNYARGNKEQEDASLPEVMEKRWGVRVRKTF